MKKLILLLLLLSSQNVMAEWTQITETNDGSKFYVDLNSRKFNGNFAKFWSYINYGTPTGSGDLSVRAQEEVDCVNDMRRTLYLTFFSQPSLGGAITSSFAAKPDWEPVAPGTIANSIQKAVCENR